MAFDNGVIWEVGGGSDTNNGGGFSPACAGFATDGAATSANTSAPVFTSASYNFITRDNGHYLFIQAGAFAGWYLIASTSGNAATLTATIGAVVLYNGATQANLVAGCSGSASPTGITWGIDYSRKTSPAISYTDAVIDPTTSTKFTSLGNVVGPNIVGNIMSVTAGTGWTVQRAEVLSVSSITATCDKSLGATSSIAGVAGLGGSLATPGKSGALVAASHMVAMLGPATYSMSASLNVSGGVYQPSVGGVVLFGYTSASNRHPFNLITSNRPILQSSTNSNFLISAGAGQANGSIHSLDFENGNATTGTTAYWDHSGNSGVWNCVFNGNDIQLDIVGTCLVEQCSFNGATNATSGIKTGGAQNSIIKNCIFQNFTKLSMTIQSVLASIFYANVGTSSGLVNTNSIRFVADRCLFYGTTGTNAVCVATSQSVENCVFINNSASGASAVSALASENTSCVVGCAFFGNTADIVTGSTYPGYKVINKIVLTGDPITNPSGGDFSLNNTAGAGALLRGTGFPVTFANGLTTQSLDVGPAQSVPAAAGFPTRARVFTGM